MTDEKQDLDNLLKHPGYQRFDAHCRQELATMLENAMENAAMDTNDVQVANKLRACIAVKQTLRVLFSWPDSRLKALSAAEEQRQTTTQLSRRGDL